MNISDIVYKINEISAKGNYSFSDLQKIRNKHGINPRTWSPFAEFSIKDNYAFHAGGRKEFQFNVGEDYLNDETIFRYGIAFSLNEDKTLHNSKAEFKDIINRFNIFLLDNPDFFKNYKMWYYVSNKFGEYYDNVKIIDDKLFKAENFIFIGKYFTKYLVEINDSDIEIIIETFDHLIPVYEEIQFGRKQIEKRITRLVFNTNGWIFPSGPYGKSSHPDSHEANYGYGHEEWLLDTGKLIDGFHYGFLEPIRKQQDTYSGKTYDVWLYTIDGVSKKRFWVGEINNIEVLNKDEADNIKSFYEEKGWLKDMEEQITASGANLRGFSDWNSVDLFNIRFKPIDLIVNDPYFELSPNHPIYEQSRYTFAHFKEDFIIKESEDADNFDFTSVSEKKDDDEPNVKTVTHIREPKTIEITYLHQAISKRLTKVLKRKYGKNNVSNEHRSGVGRNRVDIIVKSKNEGLIFYEIKTFNSLKTSIREALGQLIEYSMWPDKNKANQMVILTQKHENVEKAEVYFQHLRESFGIPIYYQWFDIETNELSEKY